MTLAELNALVAKRTDGQAIDFANTMKLLKGNRNEPDLNSYRKQYSPTGHNTMSTALRPDKPTKKLSPEKDKEGRDVYINSTVKVNRLSLSLQKIITARAVSFLFGNPVKIVCEPKEGGQKKVLAALNRILYDNKVNSFNRRIAREMFRSTEIAECWFPVKKSESHSDYGFDTEFKIRVIDFSTWDGNELYPLFDETGDLIAFSRAFERNTDDNKIERYFETYTDIGKIVWKQDGGGWNELSRETNVIGKIPVVYGSQEQVGWADVQTAIDRLEILLSNFADTNDYHAAPKIYVEGTLTGISDKGDSGGILQGSKDTKAYYLSWNHATDAVKLEIETLLRFIYSFTQTPDISFESVKGLREISGEALKMLFLDAHLKVQDKREVFDEYLQRRINIIKAYIAYLSTALKADASALQIEADIQPFIINDQKALIDMLTVASGGEPMISQKTAVAQSGLVDDVDKEYEQLQSEQKEKQTLETSF